MYGIEFDERCLAEGKWWKSLDENNKTLKVLIPMGEDCESCESCGDCETLVEFPFKYVVCYLCEGKGKHVNPSIDAGGISAQEFAEDPVFAEDYFSGRYDVQCYNCAGKRVVPEIDEERLDEDQKRALDALEKKQQADADYARICAAERAMGY